MGIFNTDYRVERDPIGEKKVPAAVMFGIKHYVHGRTSKSAACESTRS